MVFKKGKKSKIVSDKPSSTYKIIIIGDCNVGKTSIIDRYIHDIYRDGISSTIGATFSSVRKEYKDHIKKINIWDTAGQERYHSIIKIYYRKIDACIGVCSLDDLTSINNLENWILDMQQNADNTNPSVVLVGNKVDLLALDEMLLMERMKLLNNLGKKYGYFVVFTSASTGHHIDKVFNVLIESLDNKKSFGDGLMEQLEILQPQSTVISTTNKIKRFFGKCI